MNQGKKIFACIIAFAAMLVLFLTMIWQRDRMSDGDAERFMGYTDEEIVAEITARYEGVSPLGAEDGYYVFDAGGFSFLVQNDPAMTDNYRMEQYRYLTDSYFAGTNRWHEYEEMGSGVERIYTPVIHLDSSQSEEKEWFCSDVTNWLLSCVEELPYAGNEDLYAVIRIAYMGEQYTYEPKGMDTLTESDKAEVYNALYEFIEDLLNTAYEQEVAGGKTDGSAQDPVQISAEQAEFYLTLEPACSYVTADGVEYRMVEVDRALGSSYYVMLVTDDGGKNCLSVNGDPYLGSGGTARWISFLDDGNTGFSCLAYSGGSYGSLYRTEDGGHSFERVEYPSAKVELPDGTYYNPFVMPERVYEEDGKLYLVAGQGPDGDHYSEEGYSSGLYESEDGGKTWKYVREFVEK